MKKPIVLSILIFCAIQLHAQWSIEVESGIAFQSYNEVRVPNDGGTFFDFTEHFDPPSTVIPFRMRASFTFAEKNHIIALVAPLSIRYGGYAPFDILFEQTLFPEGEFIEGLYKFNSYRLTYRRDIISNEFWTLGLGFTAKIRDARIRLSAESGLADASDDFGFVPLINIFASYGAPWGVDVFLEGDGLAASQGRAFDFFMGLSIPLSQSAYLKPGYRILEGGANVEQVYNFTMVHFGVVSLQWDF